jgi:prevent-host-death family protein
MKLASLADVKAHFSAYVKATAEGPVVITRNGKAVAVLLAVQDDDELERLLMAHSPRLQAILAAARERIRAGEGIPHDEFWQQVEGDTEAGKRGRKPRKRA